MWFSEEEWHLGVTGVFPGRGLGKGHRQRWLRLEPRRGFREVLGEAAQSHGHKAEHVSVWAQGRAGLPLPTPRSAAVRTGLHWPGRAVESAEMITDPGPPGLSRGGVCVCRDPRGAGRGDFTSLLRTCILFRSTLGLPRDGAVIRRFVLLLP